MKKKRYYPFGYRMEQGQVLPVPEEAGLLRHLFSAYLEGASLRQTAELATHSGIPYHENGNGWSKCTVSRILADERYWDCKQFPPVIGGDGKGRFAAPEGPGLRSLSPPLSSEKGSVRKMRQPSVPGQQELSEYCMEMPILWRTIWATDGSGASAGNQKEAARALPDAGALPFVRGA